EPGTELENEGYVRELIRRVQEIRKEMNLRKLNRIRLVVLCDSDFLNVMEKFREEIETRVNCGLIVKDKGEVIEKKVDKIKIRNREFLIGITPV
ncbi:MAG: DUF5915 domain-containing protein, partial [Candidatus Nanoarchaeia archaeon]|nr:DUF5915 domain-containing protein [Candidatus Jingweiarchaeum tengchongense]